MLDLVKGPGMFCAGVVLVVNMGCLLLLQHLDPQSATMHMLLV